MLYRNRIQLSIDLETDHLAPGSVLRGVVHANVSTAIAFTALRLHIKGVETAEVKVEPGNSRSRSRHHRRREERRQRRRQRHQSRSDQSQSSFHSAADGSANTVSWSSLASDVMDMATSYTRATDLTVTHGRSSSDDSTPTYTGEEGEERRGGGGRGRGRGGSRVPSWNGSSPTVSRASSTQASPQNGKESVVHLDKWVTVLGHSQRSGRRGGTELDRGHYEYPFAIRLPPTLGPSYSCVLCQQPRQARSQLSYSVEVCVDIPWGFDAGLSVPFYVHAAVPRAVSAAVVTGAEGAAVRVQHPVEYTTHCSESYAVEVFGTYFLAFFGPSSISCEVVAGPRVLALQSATATTTTGAVPASTATITTAYMTNTASTSTASDGFYPVNGGEDDDYDDENNAARVMQGVPLTYVPSTRNAVGRTEAIRSLPTVTPLDEVVAALPPFEGGKLSANITLCSHLRSAHIRAVRVTLIAVHRIEVNRLTVVKEEEVCHSDYSLPTGGLAPEEETTFTVTLPLPPRLRESEAVAAEDSLLPTVRTKFFQSALRLRVSLPGRVLDSELCRIEDVMHVGAVVGCDERVPRVFVQPHHLPEGELGSEE